MSNRPTILVAVDLNDHAVGIVRRAAKLAAHCGGHLVVVHAVDHRPGYESDQVPLIGPAEVENQMARYAHAWLTGLLHHLNLATATIEVYPGPALETVCDLAARLRPLYVVVGRSSWGILSAFSGLSDALERARCDCDVLVVAHSDDVKGRRLSRRTREWLSAGTGLTPTAAQ
jgi:nucleotide-binding universal stress UspA family protein